MLTGKRSAACWALIILIAGCAGNQPRAIEGQFEDDYGIRYEITTATWTQFPSSVYHIVEWNDAEKYLIAQKDSSNTSGGGLWTRLDWMTLENMAPFEWAFCLSAYESVSAEEAKKSRTADRSAPKTGCGGHPFSRMKPSTEAAMSSAADQGY